MFLSFILIQQTELIYFTNEKSRGASCGCGLIRRDWQSCNIRLNPEKKTFGLSAHFELRDSINKNKQGRTIWATSAARWIQPDAEQLLADSVRLLSKSSLKRCFNNLIFFVLHKTTTLESFLLPNEGIQHCAFYRTIFTSPLNMQKVCCSNEWRKVIYFDMVSSKVEY